MQRPTQEYEWVSESEAKHDRIHIYFTIILFLLFCITSRDRWMRPTIFGRCASVCVCVSAMPVLVDLMHALAAVSTFTILYFKKWGYCWFWNFISSIYLGCNYHFFWLLVRKRSVCILVSSEKRYTWLEWSRMDLTKEPQLIAASYQCEPNSNDWGRETNDVFINHRYGNV